MNEIQIQSPANISRAVEKLVSEASDLYVDYLSEGQKSLATALLSGLILALASLERVSRLAPGRARTRELYRAAGVFHKLSLVIYLSAIHYEESDDSHLKTLHAYDSAADLSGLLASAARQR